MKSPNEVCRIVGITPKALRGYVSEGVVAPTEILENGYQLYDDDAIRQVILAKVFQDGGYTRKETKAIFESETTKLDEEYDKLIVILREKQKRIDGQIRTVRLLKLESRLSESAKNALDSIKPVDTYRDLNFKSCLDGLTDRLSELAGEIDSYDLDAYLLFWYSIVVIGIELQNSSDENRLFDATEEAYGNFCLLMDHLDGFSGTFADLDNDKKVELFCRFIDRHLLDADSTECLGDEIERVCGEGILKGIAKTTTSWSEAVKIN